MLGEEWDWRERWGRDGCPQSRCRGPCLEDGGRGLGSSRRQGGLGWEWDGDGVGRDGVGMAGMGLRAQRGALAPPAGRTAHCTQRGGEGERRAVPAVPRVGSGWGGLCLGVRSPRVGNPSRAPRGGVGASPRGKFPRTVNRAVLLGGSDAHRPLSRLPSLCHPPSRSAARQSGSTAGAGAAPPIPAPGHGAQRPALL